MEKYLKMSDAIRLPIGRFIEDGSVGNVVDAIGDSVIYIQQTKDMRTTDSRNKVAEYAAHAINSHDELVAMNKELMAIIERVIGSSKEFDKIMGTSEWADGYKQCAIDTGEALRGIIDNIKAKAAL